MEGSSHGPHPSPDAAFGRKEPPSPSWQAPTAAEVQALLPGYEVVSMIGRGGMGAVYRATQKSLARQVAIKVLPPQFNDAAPGHVERFKHEARTLARLSHPGIVSIFESGELPAGQLYFVMEFVDGSDLAQAIRESGKLPPDRALSVVGEVCEALEYAHLLGVIHRDIKPANILLGRDGRLKIADFGLAKTEAAAANLGLTASNIALGAHDFAAPEVLTPGAVVDRRADLYAVGVMLYQLLTGDLPRGLFKLPSQKVPGLDPRLDAIVCRAMEADPGDRYQTAGELRADLETIRTLPLPDPSALGRGNVATEPPFRRFPFWAAAVLGLLAVLASVMVLPSRDGGIVTAPPAGSAGNGWRNLLAELPANPEGLMSPWRLENGALHPPPATLSSHQIIKLPVAKPVASYDVRVRLTRLVGQGAVVIAFLHGNTGGYLMADTFTGTGRRYGFMLGLIESQRVGAEAQREGIFLVPDQEHEILLQVRPDRVAASLNGQELLRWQADWDNISQAEAMFFPPALQLRPFLGVGVCCSDVVFHRVEFREVTDDSP